MTATALIIDDEPDIRELIAMTLSRMGLDFHSAANLEEARHLLHEYQFDVCLTDMRLPDGNGVDFVRYIQSTQPALPVAVITAHGNMSAAVEAMKNGAYDFVSKPVDIQQLRRLVVQAVALNAEDARSATAANDESANTDSGAGPQGDSDPDSADATDKTSLHRLSGRSADNKRRKIEPVTAQQLIGQSEPMRELRLMMAKVARTNAPVWITGESGTGKELIAKLIHEHGPRCDNPFVAINCGAIPSELMESELFGHRKGSFTGATTDNEGLFRRANGGTLFLDEVAELPLHMQVKLLRAIQERTVRAVGDTEEVSIDTRILSASHKDLAAEVEKGTFRHDLYYRLNVINMTSPSLRDRTDDIPALCEHILKAIVADSNEHNNMSISDEAMHALCKYDFPGNVRELENILERAVAMAENDELQLSDLNISENRQSAPPVSRIGSIASSDERAQLIEALESTRWNRKAAAEKLGLTYRQLRYRIQQLGINSDSDGK